MSSEVSEQSIEKIGGVESHTVMARNPEEMAQAQAALVRTVEGRIQACGEELRNAEENLEHARKLKIKTAGWQREVRRYKSYRTYYEKVLAALQAGYFIVPEMPISIISVRTNRTRPSDMKVRSCGMLVKDEPPACLPAGEGEYVAPEVEVDHTVRRVVNKDGKEAYVKEVQGWALKVPDFPLKAVRPQILSELSRAQQLKIFDLIGILPADRKTSKRDPMIVGVITTQRERSDGGYRPQLEDLKTGHKRLFFLLKWWLDLESI